MPTGTATSDTDARVRRVLQAGSRIVHTAAASPTASAVCRPSVATAIPTSASERLPDEPEQERREPEDEDAVREHPGRGQQVVERVRARNDDADREGIRADIKADAHERRMDQEQGAGEH